MQIIDNVIISDEVWNTRFACDLSQCRGKCCQIGDLGAPISDEEAQTIKATFPKLTGYLKPSQINFLQAGVVEVYKGSLHIREVAENTPCPLAFISPENVILCSLHAYALDEKKPLLDCKPLWCSLFPLMLKKSGESWMINLHIPDFCRSQPNPPPILLSFGELLTTFFGNQWLEKVKSAYQ